MASNPDWRIVGTCSDDYDDPVEVGMLGDKVSVIFGAPVGDHRTMHFGPRALVAFRELLDRAAMPGQEEEVRDDRA